MRRLVYSSCIFLFASWILSGTVVAEQKILKVYLDADRSNHKESALSMEMGIKTAFSEINNIVQGHKIVFVPKDHRGNSVRSKLHMKQFIKDKDAIFVFAGLHSPPLIKNREFINNQKILTFVPWAAAGPITRYPSDNNWVFRLSIDDTKAGYRMVNFAVDKIGCKDPHLLLESTPWGRSNEKTMKWAVKEKLQKNVQVNWFNWNTKEGQARRQLRDIISKGADCILFVGNSPEGQEFSKGMIALDKKVPIISHWGITGGNFHKVIDAKMRKDIELYFIQSCFSFVSSSPTVLSRQVLQKAKKLFPGIKKEADILAPTGFIHAYDLGKIIISALSQLKLKGNIQDKRQQLRDALENLKHPVEGLIKSYIRPFSKFSKKNNDAHEALGLAEYCMGKYGNSNEIIVMGQ